MLSKYRRIRHGPNFRLLDFELTCHSNIYNTTHPISSPLRPCMSIVSLFDNHWLASHLASQGNGATHLEVMRACSRFGRARVTQYLVRQGDGAPLPGNKCSFRFVYLRVQPDLTRYCKDGQRKLNDKASVRWTEATYY